MIFSSGTVPQLCESDELFRLSPKTNRPPAGTSHWLLYLGGEAIYGSSSEFVVYKNLPARDLHLVPRKTDYTLDVLLRRITRIVKNDHVADSRAAQFIRQFVYDYKLAIAQRGFHAETIYADARRDCIDPGK